MRPQPLFRKIHSGGDWLESIGGHGEIESETGFGVCVFRNISYWNWVGETHRVSPGAGGMEIAMGCEQWGGREHGCTESNVVRFRQMSLPATHTHCSSATGTHRCLHLCTETARRRPRVARHPRNFTTGAHLTH